MNTAYLLLGGNLGNKEQNIAQAIALIEQKIGPTPKRSDIFITAAWGNEQQPEFYNQAIMVSTDLSAQVLLACLLKIEEELGRKRTNDKWQERTIDIDILFYNNEIINTEELKVPHPFLQDRRFVLEPLAKIAKDLIHPVLKKSIAVLLDECTDPLEVKILNPKF